MTVAGALFVGGGALEAAMLLASIVFALIWSPSRPAPAAFIALVVVGAAASAATAGLGSVLMRTDHKQFPVTEASVVESRAAVALILGLTAVVLIWPLGILLGPAAFWVGISAIRRINRAAGGLAGRGRARAGAMIGAVVSGMYLFWVLADVVAIFLFGSPLPAAP